MGAKLITVSADTQFVHLAWHREEKELEGVKFSMGSDPTGKVARMFGVFLEEVGVALRGTFVIDPEGKLMNSEVNFLNMGRNIDELMRRFKANLYLAKKSAEACPAKWKEEGDRTLIPGPELVGRVHDVLHK